MDRMTPHEMVAHLKAMGLCTRDRAKVMETYRDAGQDEAIEQADSYVTTSKTAVTRAKVGMEAWTGMQS